MHFEMKNRNSPVNVWFVPKRMLQKFFLMLFFFFFVLFDIANDIRTKNLIKSDQ